MQIHPDNDVLISEVGPRDGFQNVSAHGHGLQAALDHGPVRRGPARNRGLLLGAGPLAPGASGNMVTEDLVFMFEAMGLRTGVDVVTLLAAREPLKAGLPGEPLDGMRPEAGLPRGFVQGALHA